MASRRGSARSQKKWDELKLGMTRVKLSCLVAWKGMYCDRVGGMLGGSLAAGVILHREG